MWLWWLGMCASLCTYWFSICSKLVGWTSNWATLYWLPQRIVIICELSERQRSVNLQPSICITRRSTFGSWKYGSLSLLSASPLCLCAQANMFCIGSLSAGTRRSVCESEVCLSECNRMAGPNQWCTFQSCWNRLNVGSGKVNRPVIMCSHMVCFFCVPNGTLFPFAQK